MDIEEFDKSISAIELYAYKQGEGNDFGDYLEYENKIDNIRMNLLSWFEAEAPLSMMDFTTEFIAKLKELMEISRNCGKELGLDHGMLTKRTVDAITVEVEKYHEILDWWFETIGKIETVDMGGD